MNELNELNQRAHELLAKVESNSAVKHILPCTRGGNNRTFRLETSTQTFALKEYFRQENDKRDRLHSEFAFLTYAYQAAVGKTPCAYVKDENAGLALYEFIQGEPIKAGEVTKQDVLQAAEFFCALNNSDMKNKALSLPYASEACFSIQEHLDLVNTRIVNLSQINAEIAEDQQAQEFIQELSNRWRDIVKGVIDGAAKYKLSVDTPLTQQNRCLSPSDFGFHNALKTADNNIRFLDFEYAGWDDPAKMVGDFFSQLAVPVPAEYFDEFTKIVMQPFPDASNLQHRAQLLRKVYEVKWCCIALNVFIPVNLARRKFANPELNIVDLKKAQLAKAETLIQRLEVSSYV
jgi:hypothetical protein